MTRPASQPATGAALTAALPAAVRHLHAGKLRQAEALCRQILEARPNHHGALYLLGAVMHRMGRKEATVEIIGKPVPPRHHFSADLARSSNSAK